MLQDGFMTGRLTIGEFADATWLSAKQLRRYDALGLLRPDHVDATTGYRYYDPRQVHHARIITLLRRLDMPLEMIGAVLAASVLDRAGMVTQFARLTADEQARRQSLAVFLADALRRDQLDGEGQPDVAAFQVAYRHVPEQPVLSATRATTAADLPGVVRDTVVHLVEVTGGRGGLAGPPFVIYHGQVGWESDGPIEVCLPLAVPRRAHRIEAAHGEAWVDVPVADVQFPRILAAFEAVRLAAQREGRTPAGAPREVYPAPPGATPVCQVAHPYTSHVTPTPTL